MRAIRAVAVLAVIFASACGGGGDGGTQPGGTTGPTGATGPTGPTGGTGGTGSTTNQILVKDNFFDPSSTTVPPGTEVTWTFAGGTPHNVTFASGLSSQNQQTGTFARTFPNPGTFNYDCTLHAGMSGVIKVQ